MNNTVRYKDEEKHAETQEDQLNICMINIMVVGNKSTEIRKFKGKLITGRSWASRHRGI